MIKNSKSTILAIALLSSSAAQACSTSDFQSCKTCGQLEAAVDLKKPESGDYYRGAQWNGLFSAYVLNCPIIGAKLIKAGANPVSGGTNGSMIMTVANKWPHNNKKINDNWAAILLVGNASMDKFIKERDHMSTRKIVKEDSSYKPDYFDIYTLFEK